MEPVCPKCGNARFEVKRDAVTDVAVAEELHLVTWVFCGQCGCVVGCHA